MSSLFQRSMLSSSNSTICNSLAKFRSQTLQKLCNGLQTRTRVVVCELPGKTAESDVKPVDQLSPKERRKLRNERREALKEEKGSWKEQVETKLDVKKKPLKGWDQILDINRLASKGYVWYMVSTPKKAEHEAAEQLHIQFAQMFPGMKYEVLTPSIPSFRKLKSGRYSDSRVRLYPGCLLIRCVMNRDVYNMIRSNLRIYNFFGTKAQGTSVSDMIIPSAVSIIEIEELFRKMEEAEAEFKVLKEEADREADEREKLEKQAKLKAQIENLPPPPPTIEKGALIRINVGPFINHTGIVNYVDHENETVQLSVVIFGQSTDAELRIDEVTVLEASR